MVFKGSNEVQGSSERGAMASHPDKDHVSDATPLPAGPFLMARIQVDVKDLQCNYLPDHDPLEL